MKLCRIYCQFYTLKKSLFYQRGLIFLSFYESVTGFNVKRKQEPRGTLYILKGVLKTFKRQEHF